MSYASSHGKLLKIEKQKSLEAIRVAFNRLMKAKTFCESIDGIH